MPSAGRRAPISSLIEGVSEIRILLLVTAVQLVNVLDFMMVMPLGPDFARDLGIPQDHLGYIAGSYTAAAAIAGILASQFLDRFDRRRALAVAMLGLVLATAAGGLAQSMEQLIGARILAGVFGGPATSIALAIIADAIPPARRGRAMGVVMSAFSIVSVLGVPAGLALARLGTWRTPFFAVAGLGLVVAASAIFLMPALRLHLAGGDVRRGGSTLALLRRPEAAYAVIGMAAMTLSIFLLVPTLSPYLQFNLGYPRDDLDILYMVGGAASFAAMRLIGRAVDRFGAPQVTTVGTALMLATLTFGFVAPVSSVPVVVIFVCFMVSNSIRTVPLSALSSRVPAHHERARFMSIQSAVQHTTSATGAFVAAQMLTERSDHSLHGIPTVAVAAIAISLLLPLCAWQVDRRLRQREAAEPPPATAAAAAATAAAAAAASAPVAAE
jgi:predicted MFS family arabinose efflux permease